MDNYLIELISQIHDLCHRIDGYLDAMEDLKPNLRISWQATPKILSFPLQETPDVGTTGEIENGFVEFTDKEIEQMPKKIQNLILLNKKRCRLRRKRSGRNSFTYEIRYRRDGYDVSASGVTLELAKERMIEKLKNAKKKDDVTSVPSTFGSFARYYFENFRLERVVETTYKKDNLRLKNYLIPYFKETPIKKIMPADCKALYKEIQAQGKGKTASEVYSLMSIIFKGAILHGIIERSPLDLVVYTPYVSKSGTALTKEEERYMFQNIEHDALLSQAFAVALYTGLRPNELPTARIEGAFIVAKNSKRKSGKIEFKKIPIISKLAPYVKNGLSTFPPVKRLQLTFHSIFPNHKFYDLRTTFYTRCDEYGVSEPARDEFVGHSAGKLTDTYRDLSDSYLLAEGKKLNSW